MRVIKGQEIIGRYRDGRAVVARFRYGEPVFGEILPHKILNFIQSSGEQYLQLPINGGPDINLKINFSMVENSLETNRIFGAFQTTSGSVIRYESAYVRSANRMRFGDGNGDPLYADETPEEMASIHTLDFNKNGETFWDNVKIGDYVNDTIESVSNITIFTRINNVGTVDGRGTRAFLKVYGIEIIQNSTQTILHNYIPVELLNGTICMFDVITQTYIENLGSNVFIGG